jgi:hypothetical protein
MQRTKKALRSLDLSAWNYWCARQDFLRYAQDKLTKSCYKFDRSLRMNQKNKAPEPLGPCAFFSGAPGKIRTCDLRIRSPALYPG